MKRAMTLLEMLLALAILGAITVALASWIETSAAMSTRYVEPARWERAAEAALRLIETDLASGDFGATGPARVVEHAGDLQIRTRGRGAGAVRGAMIVRYRWDRNEGILVRGEQGTTGAWNDRVLLHVSGWSCTLDEETRSLHLRLESEDRAIERRIAIP